VFGRVALNHTYREETVMSKKIVIEESDRQAYLEVLQTVVTEEQYSAYAVHTVLNLVLQANGMEKVRPQMMYNYARNGLIVTGEKIFGATLRPFTASEVMEFVIRYCVRNGVEIKVTASDHNPNQLELELEI
jgi:hypothetical protein